MLVSENQKVSQPADNKPKDLTQTLMQKNMINISKPTLNTPKGNVFFNDHSFS
jgi:hypothetical protein